jgi:hypothetical protein
MTEHSSQIEKNAAHSSMIDKFSTCEIKNPEHRTAKPWGEKEPKITLRTSKNSLTRVALLEEILRICSNKLKQVTAPSETPTYMAEKLKLHS